MGKIRYIKRKKSVITGKENLEHLYTFKDFPVFFGCVEDGPEKDIRADMSWAICPESGVIQLDKLIPLNILYQEQHVDGTGPTWERYYQDFSSYISKQTPSNVLEIGGGAGRLATLVTQLLPKVTWTIVEPNPLIKENNRIKVVPVFFNKKFHFEKPVDTIVFSQVMEHAYDPHEFICTVAKFLKTGDKLVCAYPNLFVWLKNKFTNAINFEHSIFLTDYFIDYLFKKYGFQIENKYFYEEHSVYYTAVRVEAREDRPDFKNKYTEYKQIFMDYVEYYNKLVKDLNVKIEHFQGPVYIFGAHIFAQHLFQIGLRENKIAGILDNSPLKEGKRLYGSKLYVSSPNIIRGQDKVAVVLKVGVHRDDIIKQLRNLNPNVLILE